MEKTVGFKSTPVVNYANVCATISNIETFVKKNDYQFKNREGFSEITQAKLTAAISDLSNKKRKKLANFMWMNDNHPTMASANKFFHFLMKNVLKSDLRIRVIPSAKEIAIQEKRKVYKEALAKVQAAYADYKLEKGDFYKLKMVKKVA
jgi:hypothetical protein